MVPCQFTGQARGPIVFKQPEQEMLLKFLNGLPLAMQELQMGGTSAVRAAGGFRFKRLPVRIRSAPSTVKASIRSA